MGWLDGALRIMPSWEFAGFGHTIPFEVFLPAVLFPGLTFGLFYAWPFVEAWLTRDHAEHQLLDRPRDRPKRTGIGAGFLAFYFCLFAASSTDVLANFFHVSLNIVLWSFRFIVIIVPIIVGFVTWRICLDMAGVPGIGKRKRAVVVMRTRNRRVLDRSRRLRGPATGTRRRSRCPCRGRSTSPTTTGWTRFLPASAVSTAAELDASSAGLDTQPAGEPCACSGSQRVSVCLVQGQIW